MGINLYTLVFSDGALLSNDWKDVNLSQRENNAAQQQAYSADMWSASIHGTSLLGPELNANYNAHASALGPPPWNTCARSPDRLIELPGRRSTPLNMPVFVFKGVKAIKTRVVWGPDVRFAQAFPPSDI